MNSKTKKITAAFMPLFVGAIMFAVTLSSNSAIAETQQDTPYKLEVKHFDLNPMPKIQGSVDITKLVKSNIKTSFSDAAKTASLAVDGGMVTNGMLTTIQGFSVYSFTVTDSKEMTFDVIIDAGNGKLLHKSEGMELSGFSHQMGGWSFHPYGTAMNHEAIVFKAAPNPSGNQ